MVSLSGFRTREVFGVDLAAFINFDFGKKYMSNLQVDLEENFLFFGVHENVPGGKIVTFLDFCSKNAFVKYYAKNECLLSP